MNTPDRRTPAPAKQEAQVDALLCGLLTEPVACRVLQLADADVHVLIAANRVAQLRPLLATPREVFLLTAQPGRDRPRPLMLKTTAIRMAGQQLTLRIALVGGATVPPAAKPAVAAVTPLEETTVQPPADADAAPVTQPSTPSPMPVAPPAPPRRRRPPPVETVARLPPKRMSERSPEAQRLDRFLKSLLVETGKLGEQYFVALESGLRELRDGELTDEEAAIVSTAGQEIEKVRKERVWSLQWSVVSDTSRMIGQQLEDFARRKPPAPGSNEMLMMRTGELNEMIALGNIAERLDGRFRPMVFEIIQSVGRLCGQEFPETANPLTVERMVTRLNDATPDAWTTPLLHPLFFHIIEIDMKAPLAAWYDALKRVVAG